VHSAVCVWSHPVRRSVHVVWRRLVVGNAYWELHHMHCGWASEQYAWVATSYSIAHHWQDMHTGMYSCMTSGLSYICVCCPLASWRQGIAVGYRSYQNVAQSRGHDKTCSQLQCLDASLQVGSIHIVQAQHCRGGGSCMQQTYASTQRS
jgi:hypothetical protein